MSAPVHLTADVNFAAMSFSNQFTEIKSQAESAGISLAGAVRPVKRLSDIHQVLFGNTLPLVYHFNFSAFVSKTDSDINRFAPAMSHCIVQQIGNQQADAQFVKDKVLVLLRAAENVFASCRW